MGFFDKVDVILNKLEHMPQTLTDYSESLFDRGDVKQLVRDGNTDQMYSGLRSDGSAIAPPYRPRTVQIKTGKGQPTDRVTLHDEGNFYEGLRVKRRPGLLEIVGTDEKTEDLKEKYGDLILGLAPFAIERVKDFIRPFIIDKARQILLT